MTSTRPRGGRVVATGAGHLREDVLLEYWHALHRLQHRRGIFDEVAAFSVEGLSKSAIARVKGIA